MHAKKKSQRILKIKTAIKSAGEQGVTLENVSTTAVSPFPETGDLGRIKFALLLASSDTDIEILSYADYCYAGRIILPGYKN